MKKLLLFCVFCISLAAQSQTYTLTLDNTFGNNGIKTSNNNITPKNGQLINGSYFFISNTKIWKCQYNGTIDTTFGIGGFLDLGSTYNISNFKYVNNAIYLFGKIVTGSNSDAFIAKINENGILDSAFGINGVSRIDFSSKDIVNNFCFDSTGNLYCIGTKVSDVGANRLLYFKLNPDGSLNYSFDSSGYKQLIVNSYTEGAAIYPDGNNFLLVGTTTYYTSDGTKMQDLLLSKIDTNGNLISSFGTNGSTNVYLYGGMSISIKDVILASDKLYINYFYSWSSSLGSRIFKYDLSNSQTVFNKESSYSPNFQVENTDDLYVVWSDECVSSACNRNFLVQKILANGTSDPYFGVNGFYEYDFPHYDMGDDSSTVLVKESDGKILIAGYIRTRNWIANQWVTEDGFTMMRIVQGALDTAENIKKQIQIYPNPFSSFVDITTAEQIKSIELLDINGRLLLKTEVNANEETHHLDLANLNAGLYLVKLTTDENEIITRKIVRQ